MPMPSSADTLDLACPACAGRVSARWEQIGDVVACPLCDYHFEVQPPQEAALPPPAGRVFHFQCLRCGSVLEARSSQAGRSGKCPTCAAVFTVPEMDPRTGLARSNADPGADGENPTPVHAYAAAGGMAPKFLRQPDDTLLIECPRCARQSPVTANNCPGCGLPFTMEGVSARAVTSASSAGQTAMIIAVASLLLSLCGGIGILPGIIALMLGVSALLDGKSMQRPTAVAVLLLGAIGCVVSVLMLASIT